MNQSKRRTFSLRTQQQTKGQKYFNFQKNYQMTMNVQKNSSMKQRNTFLRTNIAKKVPKKSLKIKVNYQDLSSSIRSHSNNSRKGVTDRLKYFKNFQNNKNLKNTKLIQKIQQHKVYEKKQRPNIELMGLKKRIQSRLRGQTFNNNNNNNNKIKGNKITLKRKINKRVESFFRNQPQIRKENAQRLNINHSRIRSDFPTTKSPSVTFKNNNSYSYDQKPQTSEADPKNASQSPLRISQSTKAMKQQKQQIQNFRIAKSNRNPKKQETFTDYFNINEKKVDKVKFIRKVNLLQKKRSPKVKKNNKSKGKIEFKLNLRGIISEKLKLKKNIILRTKLKEKKWALKIKEKFLMRRKDTNQILCEKLNYLKKKITKKSQKPKKQTFLQGNAEFLKQNQPKRKKPKISRFLEVKNKENRHPNIKKKKITKKIKKVEVKKQSPQQLKHQQIKSKKDYFVTQRNSKNLVVQPKIKEEVRHFEHKFSKDAFVKSESTCHTGLASTPLECEEILGYSQNTLSSSNSRGFSNFLSAGGTKKKQVQKETVQQNISKFQPTKEKPPKMKKISLNNIELQEELDNFDKQEDFQIDSEVIILMIKTEKNYTPDAHYFDQQQPNLNWLMRGILMNWLTEVCVDFMFRRDTYYLAINYIDRYLSKKLGVKKWQLQLIGTTALYIAQKMEEIEPQRVQQFSTATDDGYTAEQIKSMEIKMLKQMKWYLAPPTINTWINWYTSQWDVFVTQNSQVINKINISEIQFRKCNENSYIHFRELSQLIDFAFLDVQSLQYQTRALVAAFMYLFLGKEAKKFDAKKIVRTVSKRSQFLFEDQSGFNDYFRNFLEISFGYQLIDLLPTIQYAASFFILPINFDPPQAAKLNSQSYLAEKHFEDFLSFQVHHPEFLNSLKKRKRNR